MPKLPKISAAEVFLMALVGGVTFVASNVGDLRFTILVGILANIAALLYFIMKQLVAIELNTHCTALSAKVTESHMFHLLMHHNMQKLSQIDENKSSKPN